MINIRKNGNKFIRFIIFKIKKLQKEYQDRINLNTNILDYKNERKICL
jgi:hypothetical protein